jgi:hypothetical protein
MRIALRCAKKLKKLTILRGKISASGTKSLKTTVSLIHTSMLITYIIEICVHLYQRIRKNSGYILRIRYDTYRHFLKYLTPNAHKTAQSKLTRNIFYKYVLEFGFELSSCQESSFS